MNGDRGRRRWGLRRYDTDDVFRCQGLVDGLPDLRFVRRAGLAWSMGHANYHLQGLIYSLALHRWLSERVADYEYDTHFGGHLYLYMRGMAADDRGNYDGSLRGVYADRWPRETILALDAALDPGLEARRARFDPGDARGNARRRAGAGAR